MKSNKGTKPKEFCLQKLWQTLKAKPLASFQLAEMETGKKNKEDKVEEDVGVGKESTRGHFSRKGT